MKKDIRRGTKRFVKGYAFMLLLCMLFSICMSAAAEGLPFSGKVVDPSTVDSWRAFFGPTADTTEYAGKVWTDKSVFADVASAVSKGDNDQIRQLLPTGTQLEGEDSFLVVLSAMASNKSIEGFEYTPTDTMLVLDMSSSMYRQGPGEGKAIKDLAKATNIALTKLLDLNQNNRVGVVIYSASNETKVLMPLNRYSTEIPKDNNDIVEYLTSDGSKIEINEKNGGVKAGFDQETQIKGSYEYKTGTWIQDGIYRAMKELTAADTEVKDGPQAGAKRMPIIVLMTDGNPTRYVTDYDGSSNEQSLSGTVIQDDWSSHKTVFLTQLTAAYSREQVKKHYGREPMFYTLGFNIGSGSQAEYVMDPRKMPEGSDLKGYWDGYLQTLKNNETNNRNDQYVIPASGQGWGATPEIRLHCNSDVKGYAYADEYYAAGSNELAAAFEKIVQRIIIQSLYYPTEASDNRHEYGGYIEFLDDIGEFMEVKDVKGIRLNNQFYSGAAFAQMFSEMQKGQHKEEAEELAESIRVRLGMNDLNEVRALLDIAAEKGHLKYDSTGHSNYVGWYADANKKYIPYGSNNEPPTGDNVKYYMKSYNYIGGANTQGTGSNATNYRATDMMYATIRVETELATGHEQVIFKVPAALIPLYSYEVKLPEGATQVENGQTVTVSRPGMNQVYPIRLIYEVGVRDDITAFNFADALEKYMQNSAHEGEEYPHKNKATGDYYLYSNKWDQEAFDNANQSPQTAVNMIAWYEPSRENERFFYTHDTVIYTVTGDSQAEYKATQCTDANNKPSGNGYYRQHFVFEKLAGNDQWHTHAHYEPIEEATLAAAATFKDGRWVIPAGRVHRNIAGYQLWKGNHKTEAEYNADQTKPNKTETLAYADFPAVEFTANDPSKPYYVDAILGNNGRLTVTPQTGLRITKKVNSTDAPTREFDIRISGGNIAAGESFKVLYSDAETSVTQSVENGALTIKLKPNQTATVIGLAADPQNGTTYTLTEQLDGHWAAPQVKVNGAIQNVASAEYTHTCSVAVTDRTIAEVEFQNIYSPNGTLVLEKKVDGEVPPHNPDFTFEVTLTGDDIKSSYQTSEGTAYVTDNKFSVTLKANEAVAVYGIGAGTKVDVSETNIPTGFAQVEETNIPTGFAQVEGVVYNRADREISSNAALIATITNAYNPGWQNPDKGIVIDLTKTIAGRNWKADDRFTFKLFRFEHSDAGDIHGVPIDTTVLTNTDHNSNVASITKEDVFTGKLVENVKDLQPGTYMFHIHEEIPSVPAGGMSYESEAASFFVKIEDKGGYLTITNVESGHMTQVVEDRDEKLWKISAAFTNRYAPRNEAMFTLPVVKEILDGETGKELDSKLGQSKAGFAFVLKHEGNEVARAVSGEDGMAELTVTGIKNATQPNTPLVYTLVEETSGRPGITDDTVEWTVKVSVTDDLNGTLSAKVDSITPKTSDALHQPMIKLGSTYAVPFYNVYDQNKATVKIPIIKTVNNISGDKMGPEGFEFELIDDKGNRVASAKSDRDGKAVISLAFNEESVGVHKGWKVREVAGTVPNMVYSTVEYVVDIKIERVNATTTEAAYLAASVTSDGKAIEALPFENIYGSVVNLPETGDDSKLLLYVIALAAAAAGFIFLRRRKSM